MDRLALISDLLAWRGAGADRRGQRPDQRGSPRDPVARAGYTVERGAAQVAARRFDVVVVGSAEAAERLRREHPAVAVIVFTRTGDVEARIRALEAGAHDGFVKWIYAELFEMPLGDAALGLDAPDPFPVAAAG